MGQHSGQKELFSYEVNLDRRIRADHPLRAIRAVIDFSFVRQEVAHCYGYNASLCSTTDPDAPCVRQGKIGASGDTRPRYKQHRAVDDRCGVVTPIRRDLGRRGDRVNRFAGDALRSEMVEWVGLDSRHLSRLDAR